MDDLDREVEALTKTSDRRLFGTDDYDILMEVGWTDEARAAALAARRAKAKGQDWRKAARKSIAKNRFGPSADRMFDTSRPIGAPDTEARVRNADGWRRLRGQKGRRDPRKARADRFKGVAKELVRDAPWNTGKAKGNWYHATGQVDHRGRPVFR